MSTSSTAGLQVRPIREKLLLGVNDGVSAIRLAGTKCESCGETTLGVNAVCPNCGGADVSELPLSDHGKVWSFTVARHRPPGNYRGPEPFEPFGIGLVELPEGLRVLTRIDCNIDDLAVDLPVTFSPSIRQDPDGSLVATFTYLPAERS